MRAPSRNLSVAIAAAGLVLAAAAAGLQILLSNTFEDASDGPGDLWLFLSQFVSSLQTAAGLVLAVNIVGVVWSVSSDRGVA